VRFFKLSKYTFLMKNCIFTFFAAFLVVSDFFAQEPIKQYTITVPMTINEEKGPLFYAGLTSIDVPDDELKKFKLPDSLHKYAVVKVMLNKPFFQLERFHKKVAKPDEIADVKEYFGTDESRYPPPPIEGYSYCHYLYILIATDGKIKDVIIDKNCNHDFNDDFVYSFKPEDKEKDIDLTVDLWLQGKYVRRNETYRLKLLGINDLFCKMEKRKYYYGSFNIQGKRYIVSADNMFQTGVFEVGELFLTEGTFKKPEEVFFDEKNMTNRYFKQLNDTTLLKMGGYDTERLTMDFDVYKCKKDYKTIGFLKNYYIPEDIPIEDLAGKTFTFQTYKGKYLLVDFWGTWCVPCIATIPDLVEAYNKIDKTKIAFLSIAREHKNTPAAKAKVLEMVTEKSMTWQQGFAYYQSVKNQSAIIKQLYSISFPSLFLIDSQGKIIARSNDMDTGKVVLQKALELAGTAPKKE
jgi:thiol-disulfide isomerase/thioredoxin